MTCRNGMSSNAAPRCWGHWSSIKLCQVSSGCGSVWDPRGEGEGCRFIVWKIAFEVSFIVALIEYVIYIYCIYTTQYIILYWHTLSSCHFPTFKCVNGTGAWTCFEDMGFFPRKEKTPPIFYPAKKSLQPKKNRRKGDVTISTQPPTKQPRYELVMRKFEDVLGPRSEALRFRCFHSLLTWPLTGGQVPGLWVLKVWSGGKLTSEMQFWDRVYIHVYTIYRIVCLWMSGNWWLVSIVVFCVEYSTIWCTIGELLGRLIHGLHMAERKSCSFAELLDRWSSLDSCDIVRYVAGMICFSCNVTWYRYVDLGGGTAWLSITCLCRFPLQYLPFKYKHAAGMI